MKIKTLLLLLSLSFVGTAPAQKLTVASYNVRYDNNNDAMQGNGWKQRCPIMCNLIQFNGFEIIGAQEVLHHQLQDILSAMPQYDYVGIGRTDGKTKGEYAPIFYNKERFEVVESGTFWLSQITDRPNTGWDASMPRICTWAKFRDKTSDTEFWHFNLHMDHMGTVARTESSKLVLAKIAQMCPNEPVILSGDFNFDQKNENYSIFSNSEILKDTYESTKLRYAPNGTFNNFNPYNQHDSRIDHIFVSNHFTVEKYGILTDTYRTASPQEQDKHTTRTPSDHFPVKVELSIE